MLLLLCRCYDCLLFCIVDCLSTEPQYRHCCWLQTMADGAAAAATATLHTLLLLHLGLR